MTETPSTLGFHVIYVMEEEQNYTEVESGCYYT